MVLIYTTKKDDVIDKVLWQHFRYNLGMERKLPPIAENLFPIEPEPLPAGYVEAVYALNPILCFYNSPMPEGIEIILPDEIVEEATAPMSAWKASS